MADFKNEIRLGISLDSQSAQTKLEETIKKLNENKISLDINIKDSNVAKQLETLTDLANNFKKAMGESISLNNIDKTINETTTAMEKLNGELLKTSVKNFNDIVTVTKNIATNIGETTTQVSKFQNLNNELKQIGETVTTVTNDTQKFNSSMKDIENAQKILDGLKFNGIIDTSTIDKLKNELNTIYEESNKENGIKFTDSELKNFLNSVKELETEEKNLKVIQEESNKELEAQYKLQQEDLKQLQKLEQQRISDIEKENELNNKLNNSVFLDSQKNAYKTLSDLQNEEFSIKEKLITAEGEYRKQLELRLTIVDKIKSAQQENISDNNLTHLQKEIDLENQRVKLQEQYNLANAKNNDKVNNESLKIEQEKEQILIKQAEAYKQIDVLKSNGIINNSDVSKLEQMVKSASSLKEINNALKSIMNTSMFNESSIVSIGKQIDDLQLKLTKMKQTFGSNLSSSFISSTESSLNRLKEDLKNVDGMNFNGIKNSLNSVKSSMDQVNNETKQMILASNTSGGFFSGISNFLGKIGVFYGVQQVVQGITDQLKEASKYTIDMDTHMSNMQMITGQTREQITQITSQFKEMASQLHETNANIMSGAEELMRAGYDDSTTKKMLEASTMASKISGQTNEATTEQLIAIKNAYNMTGDQMQHVIDTMSKLDNSSATSFKEISDAIMRTAFSANQAGTSFDTLSAYITTVSEKTRREASSIGEAFKSIYSRYSNIKLGNIDEDGKSINDVETAMNRIGISIRSSKGEFKDFDIVLQEFVDKYKEGKLSQVDFMAGINTLGGTRQKETLLALVENFDKVKEHINDVNNATGSAKEMYSVYADSVQAKINDMKRAFENLYEKIMTSDALKWLITEATEFVTALSSVDMNTVKIIATFTALGLVLKSIATFSTAFKGIESVVNLGKDAGLMGNLVGGFTRLGTSISGIATASLAFVATPLGATLTALAVVIGGSIATYEEYSDLMSKPIATTPTEDLNAFEQTINSFTGNVYKSKKELQDAGLVYKDFGENISDSFKEGVEKATESYHQLEMAFAGTSSDSKMTDKETNQITTTINGIIDDAKKTITSRKSEVQSELSKMFTMGDGKIDSDEQNVLNSIGSEADAQLQKINELQSQISDTWTKAIQEHGKLSQEDVEKIQNYVKQIEQIKAETEAKNKAESSFALNQFGARLDGISAKDAGEEYKKASDELSNNFANEKATYQTGIDDLNKAIEEAQAKGETDKVEAYKSQVEAKTKEIEDIDQKEFQQRRQYLDMLYKKNPSLQNELNEEDGSLFNGEDKNAQGRKEKLRSEFAELANVTESGMQHIQDANGKWHDIYVTFDKATGNITGAYDTLTGEFGGYSSKLENEIKTSGSKIKLQMEELQKSLMFNGGGVKLDSDNNAINATTDQLITKLDNVIQKADGTKTAIQDINGTKIRLEFDKNGALTNAQDVEDAINGKFNDNPAVVKTKIEVDGKSLSSTDSIVKKLKDLPQDKNVKISINGEEAIMTAEQAEKKIKDLPPDKDVNINVITDEDKINSIQGKINTLPDNKECKITIDGKEETNIDDVYKKLSELPPDTKTDIIINGEQISTAGEAKAKLDDIPPSTNTNILADNSDANSKADDTSQKMDNLNEKTANPTVTINAGNSLSIIDRIRNFFDWITGRKAEATVKVDQTGNAEVGHNANGTNNWKGGLTYINEDEKGELVDLPSGTRVIPHDLSEKMIEEESKNNNSSVQIVNNNKVEETISIEEPNLYASKKKTVAVPVDHDDGYFPSLQSGESDSTSSSKKSKSTAEKETEKSEKKAEAEAQKAEKFKQQIDRLNSDIDIDPYYEENNALKDVENQLTANKTAMDALKEGSPEYQQAQLKEIELYKKKQEALDNLNSAQVSESNVIKNKLSQYGFIFDANGKLINSEEKLLELQNNINAETGDSEEEKQKKQDDIKNLKEINDLVTKYGKLTRDTIPDTINQYNELANSIQKVKDEIKKVNEETLSSFKDTLAKDILKQTQDKVDKLKEETQKAQDTAKKALEDEKEAKLAQWDQQIKEKQAELDALNDESADNEAKLKKLQAELNDWKRDDSTEAQGKIQNLNTQIADLQKTIKKDNIQKDIDSLNKQKQTDSDDYDKQLKDLDDANKKQEEADEKKYKKMLEEKKAYNEADKLITSNNQKAILKILNDNAENYKDVGTLLGKNFTDAFKTQLDEAQKALNSLKDIKIDKGGSGGSSSSSHYQNTTSSGTNYTDIGTGIISDKPITGSDLSEINNSSSGKSSSSSSSSGSSKSSSSSSSSSSSGTKYVGGKTSDGQSFYFASYETGGRTPDDIDSNGKIGVLHASEKILNKDDTVKFDDSMNKIDKLYDYFKNSNSILSQQLTTLNYSTPNISSLTDLNKIASSITNNNTDNSKINNLEINNTYQVENKTDFDTKLLIKNQDKQLRDTLRKYGILKR